MAIEVIHNYGGALTHETRILPGVYDVGDPALFGLEDYLVENGHAVWCDTKPVLDTEDDKAAKEAESAAMRARDAARTEVETVLKGNKRGGRDSR